ncbi:histidine phosphatase family protein [Xaviernesmea oryzae]|uniref:Histidine phosphatase family protein n=1 Tax=Xaviernesmea oryzae TaxID=464029 RepID=A0A1Q9AUR0_9HYPH|nr:histidine phosphatase family protein [Xaviernesmea oryzae]OLP59163.1 histidine phosphatase family protein [Xaviernesmea oryzae]SEK83685.1 Broad specificity phosphatase PhoE [Xaviernesmea oryzae]
MLAIYLTHPQVEIDPAIPVPLWGLSQAGRARCLAAAERAPWVRQLKRIVSSAETKAIETAAMLAEAAGIKPETVEAMGENDRSATGFLTPDLFEVAADQFFAAPQESYRGWERAVDAQARIVRAVEAALADHDVDRPLLFVGHGAVGTLLKCHLLNVPITRSQDQPCGGGNLFAFRLADRKVLCDWTPIEAWQEKSL